MRTSHTHTHTHNTTQHNTERGQKQDDIVFDICNSTEVLFNALCTTYKQRLASVLTTGKKLALQLLSHKKDPFRNLGLNMVCELIEYTGHYSLMTPFMDSCVEVIRTSQD
eukprot:TRINITY_DN3807_c0_g1_i3.p1 TRINITY_DN3807_c0_g1~~TRINITY_DN3807_c0_g1_i3.p1  ORF type:complete len:110 (+),score=20.15 TRINITY_DN3807_c0_g1_i3:132-461(+)